MIDRRSVTFGASALILSACTQSVANTSETSSNQEKQHLKQTRKGEGMTASDDMIDWANLSKQDWQQRLTEQEFYVLRKEGTERPFTSPLNDEKRPGKFVCAGCALPLFTTDMKYDSGTGWPSFFTVIEGAVETKRDFKLVVPRTEYHCARCGGHQGHVFKDGPQPTGLRYCNNGIALDFIPDEA